MNKTATIEATISVSIDHSAGPVIADLNHVRRWLCADGQWINGMRNGFTYEVCPQCPDPDECGHGGEVSIYRALIVSADWDEGAPTETPEQSAAIVDANLRRMGITLGGETGRGSV